MLAFALFAAATVSQSRQAVVMYGIEGGISCSNAWKPQFRQGTESYIRGLWSGLNLATSSNVGHSRRESASLEDVRVRCAKDPNELVEKIALKVYYTARKLGQ